MRSGLGRQRRRLQLLERPAEAERAVALRGDRCQQLRCCNGGADPHRDRQIGHASPRAMEEHQRGAPQDGDEHELVDGLGMPGEQHQRRHHGGACHRHPRPCISSQDHGDPEEQERQPCEHENLFELRRTCQHGPVGAHHDRGREAGGRPAAEPPDEQHHPDGKEHEMGGDQHAHRPVGVEEQADDLRRVERAGRWVTEVGDPTEDVLVPQREPTRPPRVHRELEVRPAVGHRVEGDDVATGEPERP